MLYPSLLYTVANVVNLNVPTNLLIVIYIHDW